MVLLVLKTRSTWNLSSILIKTSKHYSIRTTLSSSTKTSRQFCKRSNSNKTRHLNRSKRWRGHFGLASLCLIQCLESATSGRSLTSKGGLNESKCRPRWISTTRDYALKLMTLKRIKVILIPLRESLRETHDQVKRGGKKSSVRSGILPPYLTSRQSRSTCLCSEGL